MIGRRGVAKGSVALALALGGINCVPAIGAWRYPIEVQKQMVYCQTIEDPTTPYFCDPDAVRLNVAERPDTW